MKNTRPPGVALVVGATGFVGRHVMRAFERRSQKAIGTSRSLEKAKRQAPQYDFRALDLDAEATVLAGLHGVDTAIYLYHGMKDGEGYEAREKAAARLFSRCAEACGVAKIIYLGGVMPREKASVHLSSRAETGEILRGGKTPVFELRAPMIVGAQSESWRIVRDLAVRLPFVVDAEWTNSMMQPVDIYDVAKAIVGVAGLDPSCAGTYELSGAEAMKSKDLLLAVARLEGREIPTLNLPIPQAAARLGVRFITRAHPHVGGELMQGLGADLRPSGESVWDLLEDTPMPLEESMRRALLDEERVRGVGTQMLEGFIKRGDRVLGFRK